jgi:alanine racemase
MLSPEVRPSVERELDLGALRRNYACVASRLPLGTGILGSVKANAYGHGVVTVAHALQELGAFGVATASIPDAMKLKESGVTCRIVLFGGYLPEAARDLAALGITLTVHNAESAAAVPPHSPVFVEVDAGLGRLGLPLADAERLIRDTLANTLVIEGIYTHLPFHHPGGEAWARAALERFRVFVDDLAAKGVRIPVVQALSSPGIAAGLPLSGNAVCLGRLLYGLVPSVGAAGDWGLEPVLRSASTRIVQTRTHSEDTRIGAGGRHIVRAGDTTAVIPFGRSAGNLADPANGPVAVHRGRRVPIISVSLEHAILNLRGASASVGDIVVLLGGPDEPVSLDELSRWSHLDPLGALVALDRGTAI